MRFSRPEEAAEQSPWHRRGQLCSGRPSSDSELSCPGHGGSGSPQRALGAWYWVTCHLPSHSNQALLIQQNHLELLSVLSLRSAIVVSLSKAMGICFWCPPSWTNVKLVVSEAIFSKSVLKKFCGYMILRESVLISFMSTYYFPHGFLKSAYTSKPHGHIACVSKI